MQPRTVAAMIVFTLAAVFASLTAAQGPDNRLVEKELKKLQGTWALVSVERGGKKVPEEQVRKVNFRLVIKGDTFSVHVGGKTWAGTLKLDPGRSPKQLDARGKTPDGKEDSAVGIYEVAGDTLRVCAVPEGGERPAEFRTRAGSKQELRTYRRQKAESDGRLRGEESRRGP